MPRRQESRSWSTPSTLSSIASVNGLSMLCSIGLGRGSSGFDDLDALVLASKAHPDRGRSSPGIRKRLHREDLQRRDRE